MEARIGLEGVSESDLKTWELRVNGELCSARGPITGIKPAPVSGLFAFDVPLAVMNRGYNLIEIRPRHSGRIVWAEFGLLP